MFTKWTCRICTVYVFIVVWCDAYDVPAAKIEVFRPRGFKVSIPDEEGIKLFAFHGKINEEMNGREGGTFSRDITKAKNGRWTFYDPHTVLNVGDILYYWTYVDYFDGRNKLGYTNDDNSFTVTDADIVAGPSTPTRTPTRTPTPTPTPTAARPTPPIDSVHTCDYSITTYNDGIRSCKGELLFSDEFDYFNNKWWNPEVKFAGAPDFEFVIYTSQNVIKVGNGLLRIKPALSSSLFGQGFETSPDPYNLGPSCTGKLGTSDCTQEADAFLIKPPVASGLITTKDYFSFLYGKIEIRAKLPKGDWIYPELYLNPKNEEYGDNYQSGQIRIAFLPGNSQFSKVVYGGVILGASNNGRSYGMKTIRKTNGWSDDFNKFIVEWSKDKITLSVNDNIYGHIYPPDGGFASLESQLDLQGCERWRNSNSKMAPFDKEMYVAIGVGVGGYNFPDQNTKPWSNDDPKMQKAFYRKKSQWYNTWNAESKLEVDYVKVYAL